MYQMLTKETTTLVSQCYRRLSIEWLDNSELGCADATVSALVYPVGSSAPATMPVPTCPAGLVAPAMYQYPRGPLPNEFVLTHHERGLGCDSQALVFVSAACS